MAMNRLVRLTALAIVLMAAVGGWRWWSGPERQIRRLLDDVAACLGSDDGQRGLEGMAAAATLGQYLSADVTIEPGQPFPAIEGRDAAVATCAALHRAAPGMRVSFTDVRIGLAPGGGSATVDATVTATAPDKTGTPQVDAREVLLTVIEADGRWIVSRASAVPVIERID